MVEFRVRSISNMPVTGSHCSLYAGNYLFELKTINVVLSAMWPPLLPIPGQLRRPQGLLWAD